MKDNKTIDLFSVLDNYGESDPVIIYNKNIERQHKIDDVYFMHGNVVFHHITNRSSSTVV